MEKLGYNVPDDLTNEQVERAFELWAHFAEASIEAGHTPTDKCPTCVETFDNIIEKVREDA